ncbi:MAG: D-ribitol-5-phosphate phosphatase [Chloroflexi bacterium]|nr:D-ribitol-5-phosphate phosphatase [Chloroflexota bacterium]
MIIKTILFDFGGVLVQLEDPQPREKLAAQYDMTVDELTNLVYLQDSARLATLGKMTADEHWETIREKFDLLPQELKNFRREFWGGDKVDMDLIEFIRGLRPYYTTALLSNAWNDLRAALTDEWKIVDAFQHVFISAELGMAKPSQEIYQHVIRVVGCEPHEAVFLDDMEENVTAAREAGLNAIHFRSREQALGELRELLDNEL